MEPNFTAAELEAFLDEALPPTMMTAIETELRNRPQLAREVAETLSRRDRGVHTIGGVWRSERLTCPSRERLGSLLLGALDADEADYLRFHIETIGCRWCQANLADLESLSAEAQEEAHTRRRKYFQSSAGYLGGVSGR